MRGQRAPSTDRPLKRRPIDEDDFAGGPIAPILRRTDLPKATSRHQGGTGLDLAARSSSGLNSTPRRTAMGEVQSKTQERDHPAEANTSLAAPGAICLTLSISG